MLHKSRCSRSFYLQGLQNIDTLEHLSSRMNYICESEATSHCHGHSVLVRWEKKITRAHRFSLTFSAIMDIYRNRVLGHADASHRYQHTSYNTVVSIYNDNNNGYSTIIYFP